MVVRADWRAAFFLTVITVFGSTASASEPDTRDAAAPTVETPPSPPGAVRDSPKPRRTPPRWIGNLADASERCITTSAARHEKGSAVVSLHVEMDGLVSEVKIEQSSGSAALDEAMQACFRKVSRFAPATKDDEPVAIWFRLRMSYDETK
jgi:TonB family protein